MLAFNADLHDTCEMTDTDKIMHLEHFETDPTDICLKIRIRIPDHFRWKFDIGGGLRSLSALVLFVHGTFIFCVATLLFDEIWKSENPDSNPGSLSVEILTSAEVCAL